MTGNALQTFTPSFLHRCEPTSTPDGSSSGNASITSCMPSCQRRSFLSIQWLVTIAEPITFEEFRSHLSGIFYLSQVTFTQTPYHEAVERWRWQNKVRWKNVFSSSLAGCYRLTLSVHKHAFLDSHGELKHCLWPPVGPWEVTSRDLRQSSFLP